MPFKKRIQDRVDRIAAAARKSYEFSVVDGKYLLSLLKKVRRELDDVLEVCDNAGFDPYDRENRHGMKGEDE